MSVSFADVQLRARAGASLTLSSFPQPCTRGSRTQPLVCDPVRFICYWLCPAAWLGFNRSLPPSRSRLPVPIPTSSVASLFLPWTTLKSPGRVIVQDAPQLGFAGCPRAEPGARGLGTVAEARRLLCPARQRQAWLPLGWRRRPPLAWTPGQAAGHRAVDGEGQGGDRTPHEPEPRRTVFPVV